MAMTQDFAWLTEHSREIHEKYAGKWIAVLNGQVIGVGQTAVEAAGQAESEHPGGDYILEKVEREVDVIYACLRVAHRADPALWRTAGSLRIGGRPGSG
jgi:hypothetical protein